MTKIRKSDILQSIRNRLPKLNLEKNTKMAPKDTTSSSKFSALNTNKTTLLLYILLPVFLGIIVAIGLHFYYTPKATKQRAENSIIQQKITKKSALVIGDKQLQDDAYQIKTMINAIDEVDNARYNAVHLYKVITELTPKNIYLLSLSNKNNQITITGQTFAKESISSYLSRLSELHFITQQKLDEITTNKKTNLNDFKITFTMTEPHPFYNIQKEAK